MASFTTKCVIKRGVYLEHVCVLIMAVLHHHRLVPGQRVGDAVLAFTVHSLEGDDTLLMEAA